MLKTLRRNTKIIIWSVVISFALWGGFSVGQQFQKQGRIAGEVFGKEITYQEYNSFHRANQIFSLSGKPAEDPELLNRQTWQSLIYSAEASHQKITVSDDEVREQVVQLLKAQKIEDPSPQIYRRWLQQALHETPAEFEKQIRNLLKIQKLIRQINDAPVAAASAEEAHKRFQLEQNKLSLETASFAKKEEAEAFYQKVKDAKGWEKEKKKNPTPIKPTGMIPLEAFQRMMQLKDEDALKWMEKDKGSISGPVAAGNQFILVRVLDKQPADQEKFEKEFKANYLDQMTQQKKYQRFLEWNMKLEEKAKVKDFIPKSEAPPSAAAPPPQNSQPAAPQASKK